MTFYSYAPRDSPTRQTVTIRCTDDSHAGKKPRIALFHKKVVEEEWGIFGPSAFTNSNNPPMQVMDGNRPLSEEELSAYYEGKGDVNWDIRYKYNLECPLCNYKLSVKDENLFPKLNTLAQNAWKIIELRSLGAMLHNSNKPLNNVTGT